MPREHQDNVDAVHARGASAESRAAQVAYLLGRDGGFLRVHVGAPGRAGRIERRGVDGTLYATCGADAFGVLTETGQEGGPVLLEIDSRAGECGWTDFALAADAERLRTARRVVARRTTRTPAQAASDARLRRPVPLAEPRTIRLPPLGGTTTPGDVVARMDLDPSSPRAQRVRQQWTRTGSRRGPGSLVVVDAALVAALQAEGYVVEHAAPVGVEPPPAQLSLVLSPSPRLAA